MFTYAQLAARAQQLVDFAFGPNNGIPISSSETDQYFDGEVVIHYHFSIAQLEEEVPKYQVRVMVCNPGVMYHKDGSGTPPDMDYVEYEEPTLTFEDAVVMVLKLYLEEKLSNFLEVEAEIKYEQEMNEMGS